MFFNDNNIMYIKDTDFQMISLLVLLRVGENCAMQISYQFEKPLPQSSLVTIVSSL